MLASAVQWPQMRPVLVFGGVEMPTHIAAAGDGSGRLFVVEQRGRIRVARGGVLAAAPFLDIRDRVGCCGERGLLSVAFPPGFAAKQYFYVYYTGRNGNTAVSRFRAVGDTADASSETILLTQQQPFSNHNGGQLAFGPDGYLYIGLGDGGGGGDPQDNGQKPGTLLGKLLRIDVESGAQPYSVPPSNPFLGNAAYRPEIWALGLRNPWRFSFDRKTGDLYIADVGQERWEEIDFQPAASRGGENYGWNRTEGNHCYAAVPCTFDGLAMPVAEYSHDFGCSVSGGFVYLGVYFYGDYCSGRIWGLQRVNGVWENRQLLETSFAITTFGEDEGGRLYVADAGAGNIYALLPPLSAAGVVNAASGEPGVAPGALASLFGAGFSAGATVTVNGERAPILALLGDQINFQVPYAAAGTAEIVVASGGQSATLRAPAAAVQPGLFTFDGSRAAALHADFTAVNAASPVHPGEAVLLYGTGFGSVDNQPPLGAPAPDSPLARTTGAVRVTIAGRDAEVFFAGLAPRLLGVFQVNAAVPADVPPGDADVVVAVNGRAGPAVKLSVQF